MVDLKTVLALAALTVLATLDRTTAHPFIRRYPPPPPPVRLTVHAPVSGAQLQLSRGNFLQPLMNPGIVPADHADGYIVTDQDYYSIGGSVGGPIIAYHNDVGPGYVKYDKPDIDFVAGPGVY